MNSFLICLIISGSITYIWDVVDFPNQISSRIMENVTKGKIKTVFLKKPWNCSLCMTTWITLLVLLIMNPAFCWLALLYGFITKYWLYAFQLLDLFISRLFEYAEGLIKN